MEFFKSPVDDFDNFGIKSKDLPRPVKGKTQTAQLVFHIAAVFADKIPNHFVKYVAVIIKAAFAHLLQFFLENELGFKTGMIGPGKPKAGITLHAVVADQDIFYRIHGMPEM